MLQHLRFHRRDRSNPTSPLPDGGHWDTTAPPQNPEDGLTVADSRSRPSSRPGLRPNDLLPVSQSHSQPSPTLSAPAGPFQLQHQSQVDPPQLPPISGVNSPGLDLAADFAASLDPTTPTASTNPDEPQRSPPFLGGVNLENYLHNKQQTGRTPSIVYAQNTLAAASAAGRQHANQPRPPLASSSSAPAPVPISAPTLAPAPVPGNLPRPVTVTGKRQPGYGISTENHRETINSELPDAPKTRKSLPFLKNPMSGLLQRRKASQAPDLSLPLRNRISEEPIVDPRIRGNRVHDFSERRSQKPVAVNIPNAPGRFVAERPSKNADPKPGTEPPPAIAPPTDEPSHSSPEAKSAEVPSEAPPRQSQSAGTGSLRFVDHPSVRAARKGSAAGSKKRASAQPSVKSLSRNVSEASSRDVLSSIPKHMKSTSSRFSFDMIGAAEEERLLEERHRQRQLEKGPEETGGNRDSRFDDFDEDAFDYDALDYDDDLEERIPGVNADLEDDYDGFEVPEDDLEDFAGEEMTADPDNDQENFAGFVFQRSDPSSSMTSPLNSGKMPPTPRDGDGNAIGYAVFEQQMNAQPTQPLPETLMEHPDEASPESSPTQEPLSGLGIQVPETSQSLEKAKDHDELEQQAPEPPAAEGVLDKNDELYFKGDDFDGEGDGSHFDESIFDLDDTDQYGRPIPGLFARNKAALEESRRQESDPTPRPSEQDGAPESTVAKSSSMNVRVPKQSFSGPAPSGDQDQTVAYQAALAAAAYQAAASGKFQRDDSPSPTPEQPTVTSPDTSHSSVTQVDENAHDYGFHDDDEIMDLDDYELDDDAIIAEANASALANDADGWYGHEFGFYSAQGTQQQARSSKDKGPEEDQLQYGGAFLPSGLDRSTSGRVVSREPNLTPITERSEYSNRNSMMSAFHIPPTAGSVQSPGLAQLMQQQHDEDESMNYPGLDMSMQSLMRLRSRAWGGSQVSLNSSRDGSPSDRMGTASPSGQDPNNVLGITPSHGRKNSSYSLWSQDSAGAGSASGSPTLTVPVNASTNSTIPSTVGSPSPGPKHIAAMMTMLSPSQTSSTCQPVFEDEEGDESSRRTRPTTGSTRTASLAATSSTLSSKTTNEDSGVSRPPLRRLTGPGPPGHKKKNSADSISYRKETEEDSGETRWVLERRRTGDSGEMEVFGQEVVEGGRI